MKKQKLGIALLPVFALAGEAASASGFQLSEASVANMSRAFAGAGVAGDDLSAAFYNPAGMSLIKQRGMQANFTYIHLKSELNGDKTYSTTLPDPNASGTANARIEALVPALFFVDPINDKLTFGASLTLPFGLGTEYATDAFMANQAVKSDLQMLELDVSLAYKLTDKFTVGASVGAQQGKATLTSKSPASGQIVDLTADDLRPAFNLGAMYEFDADNRAGLSWRPSVKHDLKGTNESNDRPINAELEMPDVAMASSWHKLSSSLALSTIVKWTNWSEFKELAIMYRDTGVPLSIVDEGWQDTWMFGLGLDYTISPEWTVRAGIARDETPVPDKYHRTARIPDGTRMMYSLGASWRPTGDWQIDLGYTWMSMADAAIDNTQAIQWGSPITSTLSGEYESKGASNLIGLAVLKRF
ncbi:MAG: outer membrane protein transport protein [Rickettsiales bacterium]|jgi:long-chain fatty acid transport protein|nr:outer membrane protein transport protein [Rickettsiales bacterium]